MIDGLGGLGDGREEAWAELFDRYGPALFRVARASLGSTADAEDAVQDLFVGLFRARASLAKATDVRAYLFAALRHTITRVAASRPPRADPLPDLDALSGRDRAVPIDPRAEHLERALQRLPVDQREIITLKVDGELTFREIGNVLGISPNTAASRYRYALEKLRTALQ